MAAYGEICSGDQASCLPTFLENHAEFQYVQVPDDGDCFFHSIAAYYARTGERVEGIKDPTNPLELRRYIVKEFIKMVGENSDLRSTLSNKNISSIKDLAKRGVWARNSFDTMISVVPAILHINLEIYGVYPDTGQFIITRTMYEGDARSTISLFLASNHYGLLYPIDGINLRSNGKKAINVKVIANIEAQRIADEEATTKLLDSYKKQASAPRKPHKKVVSKPSINQEQANLNAAIAASIQNLNIQNKHVVNNAAFAASLQKLHFNNENQNNHSNASSIVSNVSSVGSINGYNIEQAQQNLQENLSINHMRNMKLSNLRNILNQYKVNYNKKATKKKLHKNLEPLYGDFLLAYVANVNQRTKKTLKNIKYNKKVASRKVAHNERRQSRKK